MDLQSMTGRLSKVGQDQLARRQLRKGTQSCWECKSRKVRCVFTSSLNRTCNACRRRGKPCIGQEFPKTNTHEDSDGNSLDDRLLRLETMVTGLVDKVTALENRGRALNLPEKHSRRHKLQDADRMFDQTLDKLNAVQYRAERSVVRMVNPSVFPTVPSILNRQPVHADMDKLGRCRKLLLDAWPSQYDLDAILSLQDDNAGFFDKRLYSTASANRHQGRDARPSILPTSHPVLIARQLLSLATHLQELTPAHVHNLKQLGVDSHALISSAASAARKYVTRDDTLLYSVEGIECIVLESTYLYNSGDHQKPWCLIGRAILLAQLMNLQQGTHLTRAKYLDEHTQSRCPPEQLWFQLMRLNRYYSMTLGLPQATAANTFLGQTILEKCSSTERLQRMDCAAGGFILQRNEASLYDTSTTQMIDRMLQESAAVMPASWWNLPYDLSDAASEKQQNSEEFARAMDHLTHYHLVAQLHLPFITHPYTDHEYDYSKVTAVDASRKVLLCFSSFYGARKFPHFCRGTGFLVLIACTCLYTVYVEAFRYRQLHPYDTSTIVDSINLQYTTDATIMRSALEIAQDVANDNHDPVIMKTQAILCHLLSLPIDSTICERSITEPAQQGLGCGGRISNQGQTLQIYIPYFGTIKFEQTLASVFDETWFSLPHDI